MYKGVKAKFTQNPTLRTALEKTEEAWLEEGNTWHDNTWACAIVSDAKILWHITNLEKF